MANRNRANVPSSVKSDSLVLDVETLLVPVSILLAGLMISLSVIFGLRGANLTKSPTDTSNDTNTDTEVSDGSVDSVSIDGDPYKGDKGKAKVAIVEFTDYECPYCKQHFDQTYSDLINNYVDTGEVVYVLRDFPLSFHDPMATNEAMAAQCLFDQGGNDMYFDFHDLVFTNTTSNGNGLTERQVRDFADEVGANMNEFDDCYEGKDFADEIATDISDGTAAGVGGTPNFIIGLLSEDGKSVVDGTVLNGAYPYSDFQTVLDGLLE